MPFEIIDGLRRKVRSFVHKDKDVLDPETGEVISTLDERGNEVLLDLVPTAPPISVTRERSMMDHHREFIRSELLAMQARKEGFETFEESEDFDVEDDVQVDSPWENEFDPSMAEIREEVKKGRGEKSPPVPAEPATPEPKAPSPEPLNGDATPGDGAK